VRQCQRREQCGADGQSGASRQLSRRQFLQRTGRLSASLAALPILIACSGVGDPAPPAGSPVSGGAAQGVSKGAKLTLLQWSSFVPEADDQLRGLAADWSRRNGAEVGIEAVPAGDRAVLLIDEIDRADDEFEAFLLEVLSDFQISIPEIGTVKAASPPLVVLTSNRTRELHDALKRRCLYHWIGYPAAEREVEIVLIREPGVSAALARKVVAAVHRLRELDLAKPPGVAETIDWARTLDFLGETDLNPGNARDTLGAVVKDRDDLEVVHDNLEEITSGAP